MKYYLHLTCTHPEFLKPIEHNDMIEANSQNAALNLLCLDNRKICDLKNRGFTVWKDGNNVEHKLELIEESKINKGESNVITTSNTESS